MIRARKRAPDATLRCSARRDKIGFTKSARDREVNLAETRNTRTAVHHEIGVEPEYGCNRIPFRYLGRAMNG